MMLVLASHPQADRIREIAEQVRSASRVASLTAKVQQDEGELYLYSPIGKYDGGVSADEVIEKLQSLKGVRRLSIRINCEGGSVMDGKAIENAIRRFPAKQKTSFIDGIAASAATFIALAADKVVSAPNATWMIHEARGVMGGRSADLRMIADVLDKETRTIAESYARKTGKPADEWVALMSANAGAGTWMNAEEAKACGLTDEIVGSEPVRAMAPTMAATAPEVRLSPDAEVAVARAKARALHERFSGASVGVNAGQPAATQTMNGKGTP